jgi:hypothetical protein
MAEKRAQNERKFTSWEELSGGGRRYWIDIQGRSGWRARYVKEVDREESTLRFYQAIYDSNGTLRELHEKYPVDLGHEKVTGDES